MTNLATSFPIEPEQVRDRIQYMMDSLGLNAASFADTSGISRSVLSNVLNLKSNATIETLNKILKAFPAWNKNWLLFGEGTPQDANETKIETVKSSNQEHNKDATSLFTHSQSEVPKPRVEESTPGQELKTHSELLTELLIKQQRQLEAKEELAKPQKEILEIRVFYSDGSFETFGKV